MTLPLARLAAPFLLVLAACAPQPSAMAAAPPRHVVLVVVDGLRPDAIAAAPAPQLLALTRDGATTLKARAVEIPLTLPGFTTMVTGLPPSRHGITWNEDRGMTLELPTIFSRIAEAGWPAALYAGKSKLRALAAAGTADPVHAPEPGDRHWELGDSAALAQAFAREFAPRPPAFALVHFRDPDHVGHDEGWMSRKYLDAVRHADDALGVVLAAIAASPAAGRTTVVLTADHGGEGTHHRGRGPEADWLIPFTCRVPGRKPGRIEGAVTLLDVAPTVLAALGLPPLPGATGRAVPECL